MTLSALMNLCIKILTLWLYCFVSGYVLLYGKNGTYIKLYYVFFSLFCWGVLLF